MLRGKPMGKDELKTHLDMTRVNWMRHDMTELRKVTRRRDGKGGQWAEDLLGLDLGFRMYRREVQDDSRFGGLNKWIGYYPTWGRGKVKQGGGTLIHRPVRTWSADDLNWTSRWKNQMDNSKYQESPQKWPLFVKLSIIITGI